MPRRQLAMIRAYKVVTNGIVAVSESLTPGEGTLTVWGEKTDYWPAELVDEYAAFERSRGFLVHVEPAPDFDGDLITREEWTAALVELVTSGRLATTLMEK